MAWSEPTYTQFHGKIEGFTQKAIRFMAENWTEYEWVPRTTKNGDPILIVDQHDHDSGEATVQIADWLCRKNDWV